MTDYTAYWAELLARHRAYIAAGCISPIGVVRVNVGKRKQEEEQTRDDDD